MQVTKQVVGGREEGTLGVRGSVYILCMLSIESSLIALVYWAIVIMS